MKRVFILALSAIVLLGVVSSLPACGIQKTSEEIPAPTVTPKVELQAEVVPVEQESGTFGKDAIDENSAIELSHEEALTVNLPPKPGIDVYSWEFILANSYNSIGEFVPINAGFDGQLINENIAEAATEFVQSARNAGFNTWVSTAHRNYEYLDNVYRSAVINSADAIAAANAVLAPGLNEHQTGLAIDFTDMADFKAWFGEFDDPYMKDTDLFKWLVEHCTEYGFVLRYPEGKEKFYGTPCRHPAHFRYVGKEAAEYIMKNNLCLEEFIMLYDESLVFLPKP